MDCYLITLGGKKRAPSMRSATRRKLKKRIVRIRRSVIEKFKHRNNPVVSKVTLLKGCYPTVPFDQRDCVWSEVTSAELFPTDIELRIDAASPAIKEWAEEWKRKFNEGLDCSDMIIKGN